MFATRSIKLVFMRPNRSLKKISMFLKVEIIFSLLYFANVVNMKIPIIIFICNSIPSGQPTGKYKKLILYFKIYTHFKPFFCWKMFTNIKGQLGLFSCGKTGLWRKSFSMILKVAIIFLVVFYKRKYVVL